MSTLDPPIEIETGKNPNASIIWLHGLGADGHDFEAVIPELKLPTSLAARFIFPHAPMRPITINGGMAMRAWYDISQSDDGFSENNEHIRDASQHIRTLIHREQERGIATSRIIVAGFSQGGAVALYTGLSFEQPLAGIMALSTYVPMINSFETWVSVSARKVPVFQAHGVHDSMISIHRAEKSRNTMNQNGVSVEWHSYTMEHSLCAEEVHDISRWIIKILTTQAEVDGG